MTKKRLYVAYGSNLNLRQMAMRCPTAKVLGKGEVRGYELQFKGQPHGAFATIGQKEGASVPVAVWELKPSDERVLDTYEGVNAGHYYKKDILVDMEGGKQVSALVYIMNQQAEFGIPTHRYYTAVLEGYENFSLDVKLLNMAADMSIAAYRELDAQQQAAHKARFDFFDTWKSRSAPDECGDDLEPEEMDGPDEQEFDGQMHL